MPSQDVSLRGRVCPGTAQICEAPALCPNSLGLEQVCTWLRSEPEDKPDRGLKPSGFFLHKRVFLSNQRGPELQGRAHHAPCQQDTRGKARRPGVAILSIFSSVRASKNQTKTSKWLFTSRPFPPPAFSGKSLKAKGGGSEPVPGPRLVRDDAEHQRWEKTHQCKGKHG